MCKRACTKQGRFATQYNTSSTKNVLRSKGRHSVNYVDFFVSPEKTIHLTQHQRQDVYGCVAKGPETAKEPPFPGVCSARVIQADDELLVGSLLLAREGEKKKIIQDRKHY